MIAYAGLAGLPPQAGLYTLLVTLASYAIFGTSKHLIVAGTSASAVLLASTVGDVAVSPADYLANAAALVLLVGGLFLLAGVCRLGFIAQFLSRPVVEGLVFGLAIFVTVKQLPKLFGISGGEGDTIRQLGHVLANLGDTSGTTLLVGAGALVLLFGLERFAPKVPGGLVALVLGILASSAFHLSEHGVDIVGKVPSGLPSVGVPSIPSENIPTLIAAAGGMLLVILSESLGAANAFATKYSSEIDTNQELIALGIANAGSGFVGGLAAGGSLSQSAVNEGAGARSEASRISILAPRQLLRGWEGQAGSGQEEVYIALDGRVSVGRQTPTRGSRYRGRRRVPTAPPREARRLLPCPGPEQPVRRRSAARRRAWSARRRGSAAHATLWRGPPPGPGGRSFRPPERDWNGR
jgi:sulfate permease, SulP family